MKKTLDIILTTSLGAGFAPVAPGTMGALVGVLLWLIPALCGMSYNHLWLCTLSAIILLTLLSIRPIDRLERTWGHDPSRVVIDETVGVWICLLGVPTDVFPSDANGWAALTWPFVLWVAAAFVLFRLLDIFKPLGIRKMERYPGGWGVMADDILAGIYGLIVLAVAQLFVL